MNRYLFPPQTFYEWIGIGREEDITHQLFIRILNRRIQKDADASRYIATTAAEDGKRYPGGGPRHSHGLLSGLVATRDRFRQPSRTSHPISFRTFLAQGECWCSLLYSVVILAQLTQICRSAPIMINEQATQTSLIFAVSIKQFQTFMRLSERGIQNEPIVG